MILDLSGDRASITTTRDFFLMIRPLESPRALTHILLICGALFLSACGGGGGGGGGSSTGSLIFTADKTSVSFLYPQNQTPAAQVVTITATGTYSGTLYVSANITGQGIATPIQITVQGTTAAVNFLPSPTLAAGAYSGTVQLLACSDSACSHQVGNSPLTVTYAVTVQPVLMVAPSPVAVTAVSGTGPTQAVTVQLPLGQTASSEAIESGSPWLHIANPTPTSFMVALDSLPSGSYLGSINVTSGTSTVTLTVNYTVAAPAGGDHPLAANPPNLTLTTVEDAATSANLGVTAPSWNPQVAATVEYPAGMPSGWLSLTPAAGGEQVLANAASLSAGSYTANIRLHGAYPSTDVLVPVALTVGVGLARPADMPLALGAETLASALHGTVPVNVVSGPATSWHAASNVPWLTLTTNSGNTGGSLAFAVDATQIAALPDGVATAAQVTITPSIATMTPVMFNVILDKNLPQITSLAPYAQLTNQPARVVLRGTGFSSIASGALAARFSIQGAATNSVTLVNDTEAVAQFAALSAGTHTVSVSNALGLATATGIVTAAAAPVYAYQTIPTGGYLRSLAYDPVRGSIYGANPTTNSIMSFHYTGSAWTTASATLASAYDVGLSLDGTALYAISSPASSAGVVETLDPTTLAVLNSQTQTVDFLPSFSTLGFGVPSTNDGFAWLSIVTPGGNFGNLATITTSNLLPTTIAPANVSTSFFDGPWYAVSRDGERLIIIQSGSESPPPPMLYLNAADSIVRTNSASPSPLTSSEDFALTDNADKMLFDNNVLYDGAFGTLGTVTIPEAAYYAKKRLITPDGSRIYVMAYPQDTSGTPPTRPRVFVFDATVSALTSLGYFDVADYPTCVPDPVYGTCTPGSGSPTIAGAISLDGKTLFFSGDQLLLIVPVPATLTPAVVAAAGVRAQGARQAATPWPLNLK
jgi:hypothetical protein